MFSAPATIGLLDNPATLSRVSLPAKCPMIDACLFCLHQHFVNINTCKHQHFAHINVLSTFSHAHINILPNPIKCPHFAHTHINIVVKVLMNCGQNVDKMNILPKPTTTFCPTTSGKPAPVLLVLLLLLNPTFPFYSNFVPLQNISRSLFSEHTLVFSFILCVGILGGRPGLIRQDSWAFFLTGGVRLAGGEEVTFPAEDKPNFLGAKSWRQLVEAGDTLEDFKGIHHHLREHPDEWRAFCFTEDPYLDQAPGEWNALRDV